MNRLIDYTVKSPCPQWTYNWFDFCFLFVGCFHIQCHRNDSSDTREVCVPDLGSGHRLANVPLFHGVGTWICHLYVLHYQRQHPAGKTGFNVSDQMFQIVLFFCHNVLSALLPSFFPSFWISKQLKNAHKPSLHFLPNLLLSNLQASLVTLYFDSPL